MSKLPVLSAHQVDRVLSQFVRKVATFSTDTLTDDPLWFRRIQAKI